MHRSEHCLIVTGFSTAVCMTVLVFPLCCTLVVVLHNANHREIVENVFNYF